MKKKTSDYGVTLIMLMLVTAITLGQSNTKAKRQSTPILPKSCNLASLTGLKLNGVQTKSATKISTGSFAPTGLSTLNNLPSFCRVEAMVAVSKDSLVNFEVWLPSIETWNGKLVTTGNGGYSNALNYGDMAQAMRQGYAVIGGDTGHQTATPDDLLWGAGHPEKI
ncbi:MAG TPA: tannase/feruloyl esterase family alpha/beta hydrolase [Blastocatellia bacterium]|nr:tannase/feruloyl esterase family alpha/beta hydrolase [Blastocatellia bacterium]